jgi:hypothetical protein
MTRRLETDPELVERDLVRLVLTVVELIRQLMERQALRRVDQADLTGQQTEQVGLALLHLDQAMTRLKDHFDLTDDDLNLDLGPLGTLLPRSIETPGSAQQPTGRTTSYT